VAPDGNLGMQMATAHAFDVIILDVMLPGINGLEVCRRLRASKNQTPILFLTALGTTENIVAGLEMGGDDYLVKPFKLAELEARIKSLMRRQGKNQADEEERIMFDEITVDFRAKQVIFDGKSICKRTLFSVNSGFGAKTQAFRMSSILTAVKMYELQPVMSRLLLKFALRTFILFHSTPSVDICIAKFSRYTLSVSPSKVSWRCVLSPGD
jgi:hypothetical protein